MSVTTYQPGSFVPFGEYDEMRKRAERAEAASTGGGSTRVIRRQQETIQKMRNENARKDELLKSMAEDKRGLLVDVTAQRDVIERSYFLAIADDMKTTRRKLAAELKAAMDYRERTREKRKVKT